MRTINFRMDVLRNGVRFDELTIVGAPTIMCEYNALTKMSMRGEFLFNPNVNYITDELRPVVIIDGVEHFYGVFKIVTRYSAFTENGVQRDTIEAYDRSVALSWTKLEQRDFWPAGTSYDSVIGHYLSRAGITNAYVVQSNETLQSDREDWDVGTDLRTIINDLLKEINYESIWFDLHGAAQIAPYKAPDASLIKHRYNGENGLHVVVPEMTSEIDLYNKPNVFIAILTNPEYEEPLVATAENNAASSKLSTLNRGMRIPEVIRVQNIASAEALQQYVNRVRNESMQTTELVSIQTGIMPDHQVGDVVSLVHPTLGGVFREVSWSMMMQAGNYMSHKLQRIVIL